MVLKVPFNPSHSVILWSCESMILQGPFLWDHNIPFSFKYVHPSYGFASSIKQYSCVTLRTCHGPGLLHTVSKDAVNLLNRLYPYGSWNVGACFPTQHWTCTSAIVKINLQAYVSWSQRKLDQRWIFPRLPEIQEWNLPLFFFLLAEPLWNETFNHQQKWGLVDWEIYLQMLAEYACIAFYMPKKMVYIHL